MAAFSGVKGLFKPRMARQEAAHRVSAVRIDSVQTPSESKSRIDTVSYPSGHSHLSPEAVCFSGRIHLYPDCVIRYMDSNAEKLLMASGMDLLGQCFLDFAAQGRRQEMAARITQAMESGQGSFTVALLRVDRSGFEAVLDIETAPNSTEQDRFYLCTLTDTDTRQKDMPQEDAFSLVQKREEEIDRLRREMHKAKESFSSSEQEFEQKLAETGRESAARITELERLLEQERARGTHQQEHLHRQVEYFRSLAREKSAETEALRDRMQEHLSGRIEAQLREDIQRKEQHAEDSRRSREDLRGDLEKQKAYYEKLVEEKNTEIGTLEMRLEQRTQEHKQTQKEWLDRRVDIERQLAAACGELQKANEKYDRLFARYNQTEADLKEQLAHFREMARNQREDIEQLNEKLTEQVYISEKVHAEQRTQIKNLERAIAEKDNQIAGLSGDLENRTAEKNSLTEELETLRLDFAAREKDLQYELDETRVRLSSLRTDSEKMIEEFRAERDHFRSLVQDQTQELQRLNTKLEQQAGQSRALEDDLREKRDYLMGSVKTKTRELETLQDAYTRLQEQYRQLEEIIEHDRGQAEKIIREISDVLNTRNAEIANMLGLMSSDLRRPIVELNRDFSELDRRFGDICDVLRDIRMETADQVRLERAGLFDIAELFDDLRRQLARMNLLLDGILQVSRTENAEMQFEPVDMRSVIESAVGELYEQIHKAGITLHIEEIPNCVGDAASLKKVFRNLMENAIKYCRTDAEGMIRILGWEGQGRIFYCVEDDGIGIAPPDQARAMAMFGRCAPDRCPGEGLGLSIARRIIERHGGTLSVESEPNEGSRFFVVLPAG